MKPITNILLVLAIVCYVFLPFYSVNFQGSITGYSFTAGTITQQPTARHIVFALLPFISCFLAIGFNTLRNRWRSIASAVMIVLGLCFFNDTHDYENIALTLNHAPEVMPSEDIGEGFHVLGLGIGYTASCTLLVLALISAILSVLPFDFNFTLERAVDQTIDRGLEDVRTLGSKVSGEMKNWHHHHHTKHEGTPGGDTPVPPPLPPDPEDPARFMPK